MLFLLFQLDNDCYALDANEVVEILPLVTIKRMLSAPPGIAGTINYRGAFVPVVDLSQLALGRPAPSRLSTRIVLARASAGEGQKRLLGLIAENATETLRIEAKDFVSPGIVSDDAPYLGPIAKGPRGPVQRIEVSKLLPAPVWDSLFKQPA